MYTKLENKYLLDTASFLCLNFQTFSIIIYTFIRLKLCCWRGNPDFHAMPYDMDTCVRRVTLVQAFYNTSGKCYLKSRCSLAIEILMFFLIPLLNAILQIVLGFSVFFIGCESNWQMATLVIKSVLYIYYGCFWYVVYVQRVYLNCQLNNALDTIRKLAGQTDCEGTREGARRLIDRIYSVFNVFRYFTGWLMAFTLLTVTFHSLCCGIFSYCKSSMVTSRDSYLIVMLWIQNIMFFVVPIYAIGGLNLESLWKNFRHVLIKCKVQGQSEFWNEVWSYVTHIDTLASFLLVWTGLFPFVGVFLKFMVAQRDSISLEYWSYLSKSCIDSMESNTCLV
ncbi:uncharacterized protein LOC115926620 [Strongylocentrotus purpuratus]|uniref:Gustatory receptor n=1 Tax=Strongylocentrotus purpuratus TaxID=7668 RepID=A0A7M7P8H0_STRPU|nr:uncharacterized protein LOC115926620 [Strongylocentrotus purpuratus]